MTSLPGFTTKPAPLTVQQVDERNAGTGLPTIRVYDVSVGAGDHEIVDTEYGRIVARPKTIAIISTRSDAGDAHATVYWTTQGGGPTTRRKHGPELGDLEHAMKAIRRWAGRRYRARIPTTQAT